LVSWAENLNRYLYEFAGAINKRFMLALLRSLLFVIPANHFPNLAFYADSASLPPIFFLLVFLASVANRPLPTYIAENTQASISLIAHGFRAWRSVRALLLCYRVLSPTKELTLKTFGREVTVFMVSENQR
jgi:hypothetical protein